MLDYDACHPKIQRGPAAFIGEAPRRLKSAKPTAAEDSLDVLDDRLKSLAAGLEKLEEVLGFVMGPEVPGVFKGPFPDPPATSPLVDRLRALTARVEDARERVKSILDRLAV